MVRYDDLYQVYVDEMFQATNLNRNQIIRLALFTAPFNQEFLNQLDKFKKKPLPRVYWEVTDSGLWMDREFKKQVEGGKGVNGNQKEICIIGDRPGERPGEIERSAREVCERRVFKQTGGVTIKLG